MLRCSVQAQPLTKRGVHRVSDLDFENQIGITRAGVIIYTRNSNGNIIYGLGIDRRSDEITDFGGGVKKTDDSFIDAAFREFAEETLELAPRPTPTQVRDCYCVVNKRLCFVFYYLDWRDYLTLLGRFRNKVLENKKSENVGIISYTKNEMIKLMDEKFVREHCMYKRVVDELRSHFQEVDLRLHEICLE